MKLPRVELVAASRRGTGRSADEALRRARRRPTSPRPARPSRRPRCSCREPRRQRGHLLSCLSRSRMRATRLVSLLLLLQTRGQLTAAEHRRAARGLRADGPPRRRVARRGGRARRGGARPGRRLPARRRLPHAAHRADRATRRRRSSRPACPARPPSSGSAASSPPPGSSCSPRSRRSSRSARRAPRGSSTSTRAAGSAPRTRVPHLPALAAAVWRGCRVRLRYREGGRVVQRTIDPLGLVLKGGRLVPRRASLGRDARLPRLARRLRAAARRAVRAAGRLRARATSGRSGRASSSRAAPRVEVTVRVDEEVRRFLPGEPRIERGRPRRGRVRAPRRRLPRAAPLRRRSSRCSSREELRERVARDGPRGRRAVRFAEVPSLSTYALFIAPALALLAIPGPAVLYVVSRSIDQGRARGLASVLRHHDRNRRARRARDRRALVAHPRVDGRLRRRPLRRRRVSRSSSACAGCSRGKPRTASRSRAPRTRRDALHAGARRQPAEPEDDRLHLRVHPAVRRRRRRPRLAADHAARAHASPASASLSDSLYAVVAGHGRRPAARHAGDRARRALVRRHGARRIRTCLGARRASSLELISSVQPSDREAGAFRLSALGIRAADSGACAMVSRSTMPSIISASPPSRRADRRGSPCRRPRLELPRPSGRARGSRPTPSGRRSRPRP